MIPVWLSLAYTALTGLVLAVYWVRYGWRNYLWFSDVALIGMVPALWLESAYLTSLFAAGMLLPELFWNVSFFVQLASGRRMSGLTDYMFERERPLFLRALSLFHVVLPAVMLYLLARLGYDRSAFPAVLLVGWSVLLASYFLADPAKNINWVRGLGARPQTRLPPPIYLALAMAAYPLLVFWPTHRLLIAVFG